MGGDFDDIATTSEDMANRRLRADSARRIALSIARNDVLIVLFRDASGEFKIAEIGANFGYCGTTSGDMANRSAPVDPARQIGGFTSRNGVLTGVGGAPAVG